MAGLLKFISSIRPGKEVNGKAVACENPPALKRTNARLHKKQSSGYAVRTGLGVVHDGLPIREDMMLSRQVSFEPGQSMNEFEAVLSNPAEEVNMTGFGGQVHSQAAISVPGIAQWGREGSAAAQANRYEGSKSMSHLPIMRKHVPLSGFNDPHRRISEEAREVMEAWLAEQEQTRRQQEREDHIRVPQIQDQLPIEREEEIEEDRIRAQELENQMRPQGEGERLAAQRARLRECAVCGDLKDKDDFPGMPPSVGCEHPPRTCGECLQAWMASEFETKGCDAVKCPECPQSLTYDDVQRAASTEVFEAYDKLATRLALGALDDFSWCLKPGCGSGQCNVENRNFMDCVNCGYKQCLRHKVPWHPNETCGQYDYRTSGQKARDEERQTEAILDSISKKCPGTNCGWRIQKTDGCEHMTCKKCKHQFCWLCLASHKEIKRVGNTAHAVSCKFHSNNLRVSWPFNAH